MKNSLFLSIRIIAIALLLASSVLPNFMLGLGGQGGEGSVGSIASADYTAPYDLIVDKSVDDFDADAGWIDYKITYENDSAATLTDVYVNDIVPEGLTFGGVPLSNPLLGAPVMPIIPDGDPLTSDVQLIREGITLTPGQIGEMIVRFTIDAGADLPNVVNEAKAGVANTDPENGPVCEPFVTGSNNTSSSGTAVPLPPVPNDAFKEDLLVNKTIILEPDHPLGPNNEPLFFPGGEITFQTEVCYNVDPLPAPDKLDIYLDEVYPSNLQYVSDTAPVAFDQHVIGERLIWRGFPIDPNAANPCVIFDTTYIVNNIEGSLTVGSNIGTVNSVGQNGGPGAIGESNNNDPDSGMSNNFAGVNFTTEGRDLGIEKRISAVQKAGTTINIVCGGDGEPGCPEVGAEDLVTYELEYTLHSGQPRTDIVVLDPFPVGDYIAGSASPAATNEINGALDIDRSAPRYSLPDYTDKYIYRENLALSNPGDSDVVQFTVKLPSASCTLQQYENIAYVSILGVPDGTIIYPITLDAGQVDGDGNPIRDGNLNYLDTDTEETDISNNISNGVTTTISPSTDPACTKVIETDLVLDGKFSDADTGNSTVGSGIVYPGQIIEYTIDYSNVGDGRGYVYLDDLYDPDQLEFVEVVNTGNLREATESPIFDRWNSQSYIDNQHNILFPYYMEAFNDSANYLTNTPTTDKYNDYQNADVIDSINYYCYERNPELNRLMAQSVDQYQQQYVGAYQSYLAAGYNKDDASIEATFEVMRDIRQWVSTNFDPADYHQSMYDCVNQGQINYFLTQGYSQAGAENAAQAYVDDPVSFVGKTKDYREFHMSALNFMNNIYSDTYNAGSYNTRDPDESFNHESGGNNYHYGGNANFTRKYRRPQGQDIRGGVEQGSQRLAALTNSLTSVDNQFMHPWFYNDIWLYNSLGFINRAYRNSTDQADFRNGNIVPGHGGFTPVRALQGMDDFMFWDITDEYSIPQYLIGSIGQGSSPTPEYQGHKSVRHPEAEALLQSGQYDTPGNKFATSTTTEYRPGVIMPSSYQTFGVWQGYNSVAMHNLYTDTDSSNTVTYRFRVKENIAENFEVGEEICNTAVIATNRSLNISGRTATHGRNNGEYTFGCAADKSLLYGSGDNNSFEIIEVPFVGTTKAAFTEDIYNQVIAELDACTDANGDPCNIDYSNHVPYNENMTLGTFRSAYPFIGGKFQSVCRFGEGTTIFSRHDETDQGNGLTNWNHNNIAVKSETNADEENYDTHCLELGAAPYDMGVSKESTTNNFVPGAIVTYQIEACNYSAGTIPELYVTDEIPAGLTYVGTLLGNGQGVSEEDTSVGGKIIWTLPNVPGVNDAPNNCVTITPEFQISPDFTGTSITNKVEISALYTDSAGNESILGDPTPEPAKEIDAIAISQPPQPTTPPPAAQSIGKTVLEKIEDSGDETLGSAGDIITYELLFSNNETEVAYFNLEDDYSSNLQFISAGVAGDNSVVGSDNGDTVTWNTVEVAPGATESVLVQFRIDPNAGPNEEYTNDFSYDYYAIYECNDGDTNPANNADSTDLPFDLALTKKLTPDLAKSQYSAGDDVSFDIELYNQGIIDATDVLIADDIPAAGSCFSFDPAKNAGWSQVGAQAQYTHPSLAAGDTVIVPLVFTISASCQELQLTNFAEIGAANDSNGDPATDIDSTPDTNLNNDGTPKFDEIDESGKDGNDEDDHDNVVINLAQNFDLSISKGIITEAPYHGGDFITYEVKVVNEGTLDGNNVEIIDYILPGFTFDPSFGNNTAEGWTTSGANAVATIPSVPVMTTITKQITVQLAFGFEGEQLANVVAITEDNAGEDYGPTYEDVDSDPSNEDTDGDGIPDIIDDDVDGDGIPNDEDDDYVEDFEDDVSDYNITLGNEMDLSLVKSVDTTASPGPYVAGSTVVFNIDVTNDTDIDAYAVDVTDYIDPAMFIFTPNNGWIDDGMGNAIQTIPFLTGLDSTQLTIELTINPNFVGTALENSAEISAFDDDTNPDNEPPTDVDSDPDSDNNNDDDDEDDEDTVDLPFDFYDLALTKTLSGPGPYYPGDTISFEIEVFNQGTLDAADVQVTDYTPAGLILTGADWIEVGGNAVYEYMMIGAGESDVITIDYIIDPTYVGVGETNRAEISEDNASTYGDDVEDIDSTPDATNDDVFSQDNQVNEDATVDEDDHDPAEYTVEHIYDLALTKVFTSSDPTPIVPGGDITYTITVHNQGTWIADDIEVTDYLAPNLILNDANWTLNGSGFAVYNSLLGPIPAGDTQEVTITTTIDPNFMGGSITNNAEISDDDSEENGFTDIDSTADGENNDPFSDDNSIDGDGTLDEDDHDPEEIFVEVYDLALTKVIDTVATQFPVYPGDDIFYTIEVFNQGTLTAENIEVTDYTPDGLTLADPNWTLVNGNPTTTIAGPIVAGGSETVDIRFTIDTDFTGTSFTNVAEISADNAADYGTADPDSDPDANNDDLLGEDDQLDGDGTDDSDDSDPAVAMIGQIYDLALVKTVDPNTQTPIVPGGSITFLVEVINQGTLPAAGIEITDTLPASLSLNDPSWVASGSQAIYQYSGTILPGESDFVSLTATIDPSYMGGSLRNNAEISDDDSEVYGTTDVDSQPDGDPTNDAQGTDNQTDGDGTDDEDDADWADFVVEVYDLALTKAVNTVATNFPVYPGDSITYTLTVFNQGTLPASNVELTDYTPDGLTLNDPTWTLVNGNPTYQLAGPIVPGGQMEVDITFMIDIDFTGTSFQNIAEISDDNSEDFGTADPDSDPDANNDDVLGEDNQLDGNGTDDSDDSDPADVMIGQIYDLSLDKAINEELTDFPVFPGDEVTYTITVSNEGTLPAADLEITDYTPNGLILNDADWILSGTNAITTISGPILPGANTSVDITFIIDPEFTGYTFTNNAEITEDDADVYGTVDVDSIPGNGPDGEEDDDDDDVQVLNVDQIYDLALTKTLDETQLPVYPGDDITFTFTIDNQGTLPAANIELTDYTPSGLTLNDADWTTIGNNAQTVFAGPIPAGSSDAIEITYTINLDAYGNSITNRGEISDDDSELYDITDIDSDPDADNGNDNYGADDQTDGNGGNIDTDGDGILDIYDTDTDGDGILDVNDDDDDGDGIPDTEDDDNDEDDNDPATFPLSQVYDLAIDKSLDTTLTSLPVYPGDDVTFMIEVTNQGTVPAANVEVTDYIPTGLVLNDADWTEVSGQAVMTLPGTILPGASSAVAITFTISDSFTEGQIENVVEISDDNSETYTDSEGNPLEDLDSNPDADPSNDGSLASLAGTIFFDDENDDNYNGDQGIAGIPVYLFDEDGNIVAETVTDANGNYEFTDLVPGNYSVGYANNTDYTPDSSAEGSEGGSAGIMMISDISLASGEDSVDNNFGLIDADEELASLAGTIVFDDEDDDNYDGDQGIAGIPVFLLNEDGNIVAQTITDADGNYSFPSLPAGNYTVGYTNNTDYVSDSSAEGSEGGIPGLTTIGDITLDAGDESIGNDFGLIEAEPASLGGTIVFDDENDDSYDGDQGIAGIPVFLFDEDGNIVAETVTDADGNYEFTDLAPGDYSVGYANNTDYSPDSSIAGSEGGSAGLMMISDISLASGEDSVDNDFGLIDSGEQLASLGGTIVFDDENDDNYDGDQGIAGIPVFLLDDEGNIVAQTVTDENGNYEFTNLPAGNYTVGYTNNTDYASDSSAEGSEGGIAGLTTIGDIVLDAGDNSINNDFGLVDGTLEDDIDNELLMIGQIYDLALTKTLVTEGPFQVGSQVTFELNVINQGTLPAANIELTDYTPAGLKLDDYDWTSVGGNAVYDLAGPILAGESMIVEITYVITSDIAPITNTAEISADDSAVYGTTDIDSIADDTLNNDALGEDNQIDGNGTDDEDDSDIALIDFTVTTPTTNTSGGNNGSSNNNSSNSGSSGGSSSSSSSSSSNSGGGSFLNSAPEVVIEPVVVEEIVTLTETDLVVVDNILQLKEKVAAEKNKSLELFNSAESMNAINLPVILPNTGGEIK